MSNTVPSPVPASLKSISRASAGLAVAAVTLVVPLVVVVVLYIDGLNADMRLLAKQQSSIRVMRQFVALQVNLSDEYYSRFYPATESMQTFAEGDASAGALARHEPEPDALLMTQLDAMDRELGRYFGTDFRSWPELKQRFIGVWSNKAWSEQLAQIEGLFEPGREFVEFLLLASNLELSQSEHLRLSAHLLFGDLGHAKSEIFAVAEHLAQASLDHGGVWTETEFKLMSERLDQIRVVPVSERQRALLIEQVGVPDAYLDWIVESSGLIEEMSRLREKKRRLMFIQAMTDDGLDMGLALEVEAIRGEVWDLVSSINRLQIVLANNLDVILQQQYDQAYQWRMLTLVLVVALIVFSILLGLYIVRNIRLTQIHLGRQNLQLEAKVVARTEEIEQAKNEAEQLNKILGKQTQISTELARKAEQASNAKSMFLASMSHEIRTPLNAVLGGAAILAKSSLNQRQRDILQLITQSGKTLLELINEILDFSKIEAGQLELETIAFDLEQLVLDIVSMFSLKARENNIRLTYVVDVACEGQWLGDPLRVKQILMNLISNAVKFTSVGKISVRVQLDAVGQLKISVADTGIGIKSDQLSQLFEAFVQSDSSTTRKYGGTGLGLSISRKLAQMHGGDISVVSTFGRGSTFVVKLPLLRAGEKTLFDPINDYKILLLSENEELQNQMCQWYGDLKRLDDVESFSHCIDNLAVNDSALVVVADSGTLVKYYQQWTSQLEKRKLSRLKYPWVLLFDQSALDCDTSELLSHQLRELGASVQLPLLSPGALIRKAVMEALNSKGREMLDWTDSQTTGQGMAFSGRVLLVEDVLFNQVVAREMLESMGLEVVIVDNGAEAIAFIKQYYELPPKNRETIRLILMDLHMPLMNGLEATKRIRAMERDARLPAMPIVALTADVLKETQLDIVEAGMDGLLPKPFEEEDLIRVLSTHLPGKESLRHPSHARPDVVAEPAVSAEPAEPQSKPTVQVLNTDALLKRVRGREDRARDLAKSFLNQLAGFGEKIQADIQARDFSQLVFNAHTVKGSAGNLGADVLYQISSELEKLARQAEASADDQVQAQIEERNQAFVQATRQLQVALEAFLA
ncbi:hybrid sensor histidine kinase/response regulator [Simiduia agarivorans]|uniref:histidine kinase n=1 Tax=Simiduia agarivorans (strain DSM 21679 / JCM 13881 / BCRC 17597 / SA1) TaxID=1117647 RepID=K4KNZ9_SIMAS|nr:ATP-binding protein [Simiduia agarivorans]AFV00905.1 multi-sensor hybrid histidine kinase [Simiduia agarivorans SA1 = DSM 21679]